VKNVPRPLSYAARAPVVRAPFSAVRAGPRPLAAAPNRVSELPTLGALGERALRLLAPTALLLVVAHLLTQVLRRTRVLVPEALLPLFDMSSESGLNTWLSVATLLALGASLCLLAHVRREKLLHVGGLFFVLLSLDDQVMLHERVGALCWSALRGAGTYPWLIAVAPVFAAIGLLVFVRLWRLGAGDRAARLRLVLGFGCLALALGIEWIESRIAAQELRWRGVRLENFTIPVEEALELLGPALLLACVAALLERAWAAR
jgi:hypothetical protein